MAAERALAQVSLDDKYTAESGRVYLTGSQALARLPMLQRRRDEAAGLNTAGFISGYRGSPLGALDQRLWEAKDFLARSHIHFQPGVNEELAATAVWGSQQTGLFPGARYDGVFAMWYGKGPGVDRAGDVLKHGNFAGSARHGGVLLLAGDDHNCKSSTVPHQSEHAFVHAMIPVLNPANVQEILDYGLIGWAMSRFSGCWVAMKTIADTVDSSASVTIAPERLQLAYPDFPMPADGLNIRWPDPPLVQEHRLMKHKLYAALAFARANRLDRVVLASPRPRLGIVTTGKSYLDVRQALDELDVADQRAGELGLTIYKVGMPWPLERDGARHFAEGLEEIVVVEEKRAIIENQLKEQLYNWRAEVRPRVVGKFDENLDWILPSAGELTPAQIAVVIGRRLLRLVDDAHIAERVAYLENKEKLKTLKGRAERRPTFCSGCPHNTSTIVPEGSRALAGIGCHYMATWLDRRTDTFSQMGGEGVAWVGQAPFTDERHVFANLGDGTYYHSGVLAIRQAVAAGANITYKLLFNDAVAMTGGQPVDGKLTVPGLVRQLQAEGVGRVVVVSSDPGKHLGALPASVPIRHRDELDAAQRELRDFPGVSALVYDQTCATELRRRRKRGKQADPPVRVVVNELLCEGCGDCSKQSSCVSVVPSDTEWGRKRQIDQSSCNKDLSCVKGFCPALVTVEGGRLRKPSAAGGDGPDLTGVPAPMPPEIHEKPWSLYVTGVGGTGVVTIGAVLGMAAHMEGLGVGVLDMAGLAQKGGAVASHLRFAQSPDDIHSIRIAAGGADAVLAGDAVTAAAGDALSKIAAGRTRAVVNTHEIITVDFLKQPDFRSPMAAMLADIAQACGGEGQVSALDATRLAVALLGDAIAANPFLLGFAWQKGLIPLSEDAILAAMRLNGAAVTMNIAAFRWGRLAAHDLKAVEAAASPTAPASITVAADLYQDRLNLSAGLDAAIARRVAYLTAYQDAGFAARYQEQVERIAAAERRAAPGSTIVTQAVAHGLFHLMAVKDEYETARLFTDSGFLADLGEKFEGDWRPVFHFAPPMLGEHGDGAHAPRPRKRRFPAVVALPLLRLLARARRLRGSWLDPFRFSAERRASDQALADYLAALAELSANLRPDNLQAAADVARTALDIRGFGPVRAENAAKAHIARMAALARFSAAPRKAPHAFAAE